jgi:hypothetical protein
LSPISSMVSTMAWTTKAAARCLLVSVICLYPRLCLYGFRSVPILLPNCGFFVAASHVCLHGSYAPDAWRSRSVLGSFSFRSAIDADRIADSAFRIISLRAFNLRCFSIRLNLNPVRFSEWTVNFLLEKTCVLWYTYTIIGDRHEP